MLPSGLKVFQAGLGVWRREGSLKVGQGGSAGGVGWVLGGSWVGWRRIATRGAGHAASGAHYIYVYCDKRKIASSEGADGGVACTLQVQGC